MPKIFISYRRADSAMLATHLAVVLKSHDIEAFVDTRSIDGGGPFPNRLRKAIEDADVFVCLLGATTLESEWVRKEIEHAHTLEKVLIPVFQERYVAPNPITDSHVYELLQSDGVHILDVKNLYIEAAVTSLAEMIHKTPPRVVPSVSITPVTDNPARLRPKISITGAKEKKKHHVLKQDGKWTVSTSPSPQGDDSSTRDENEIKARLEPLTTAVLKVLPSPFDWCFVSGGNVTLETDPPKTYTVPDFAIAKYTITNAQFQVFIEARDGYMYENDHGWFEFSGDASSYRGHNPKPRSTGFTGDNLPRTNVSWFDAVAFCRWLSNRIGQSITLPTEEQWQRAAVGDKGWAYPWGNQFDSSFCNTQESGIGQPVDVTEYPNGASPYGVFQMSGNVYDWCLNNYDDPNDIELNSLAPKRVVRGGSWQNPHITTPRAFRRHYAKPTSNGNNNVGFRIVISSPNFL